MTALTKAQKPDPSFGLSFPAFVLQRTVDELDQRIVERTGLMLAEGWIEETQGVLENHDKMGPGLRSIGYREIVDFLDGKLSRQELGAAIVLVTRQYAKRQRTWFRNMKDSVVGDPGSDELFLKIRASLSL